MGRRPASASAAERPAKRKASASAAEPDAADVKVNANLNVDHYAEVSAAWERIMAHDAFRGIVGESPLSSKSGGLCQPVDYDVMARKMEASEDYLAGINAAWVSWSWTVTPGVPINRTGDSLTVIK